jgi:hypothetical protein
MRKILAVFSSGLKQLSKSRLITIPVVLAAVYPLIIALLCSKIPDDPAEGGMPPAEAAMGVIFMAVPMAATLAAGFIMILGSSLLPEEISAGRAGYWVAQPVSRNGYFTGMTLSSMAMCCLVTGVLFYGTSMAAILFFPYTPNSIAWALLCPMIWATVNLALVTLVSLFVPRIASIIICLAVAGVANFLGSLGQVADALPSGAAASVMKIASTVSFFVFPADPLLRLAMYGLKPVSSSAEQMLAFMGVGTAPPVWQAAYALVWIAAASWLAAARFRRIDLA